jgi:hypothetical protein
MIIEILTFLTTVKKAEEKQPLLLDLTFWKRPGRE